MPQYFPCTEESSLVLPLQENAVRSSHSAKVYLHEVGGSSKRVPYHMIRPSLHISVSTSGLTFSTGLEQGILGSATNEAMRPGERARLTMTM
jgi:hypothetical protein